MVQSQKEMVKRYHYGGMNRLATVFWYLSDVKVSARKERVSTSDDEQEGGWTSFPRAGGLNMPSDFHDCNSGFRVSPKKGKVIIFYRYDNQVVRLEQCKCSCEQSVS